eukprot:UN25182
MKYNQTVLACVLLEDPDGELTVISVGVGTKFLKKDLITQDISGDLVHDCHAEILAVKGFQQYLAKTLKLQRIQTIDNDDQIFIQENGKLKLHSAFRFHFYTSTAPCGNAVLKKFCKGGIGPRDNKLDEYTYPNWKHDKPTFSGKKEGSLGFLFKRDNYDSLPEDIKTKESQAGLEKTGNLYHPIGTIPTLYKDSGHLLTCSDRLLSWNALGYQGSFYPLNTIQL